MTRNDLPFAQLFFKFQIFDGNIDSNSTVSHTFPIILVANSIQILPLTWNGTQPALRLEIIGCYEGKFLSSCCYDN